jgi:hypothetical protein
MHGWGLLQLLVIINYLVLFIEYAYQTLVCPMLYRYHLILLLYFVCLFVFFYWFFFYCYIVLCVYITHCIHIFNHCNDLALNGSLIGNKHICICICMYIWIKRMLFKHIANSPVCGAPNCFRKNIFPTMDGYD